ncbi:UDP-N-acetylglucosamine 2-epimerase (non-hydrolyzing) [Wohlfahrtiimonas chitiniclastica]|uniref:non-hydrolyzing UDP-N-acetylglucosamine 2-epimerase n=1 Tax=Wohlfahrtiimonas chitiniclastica TaxID=400946 RepID=UPI000B97E0BD|nr:UDP-N-acetylglucosamine 2-epimerase (non-hydrolyzing) [Wohlfahrtiimonas chitiniclastica]OYQ77609.1 UDP-N-acetylglucosamine 2-epimerase (non-hydrolyzing) [Wohlfahrtiimonas chitiniclastica]
MKKLKVATVLGTRPEIIRLSKVIEKLDQYTDHTLIHTGQNYDYELNQIFFDDLGLRKPDYFLDAAGEKAVMTIGNIIHKIDDVFETIQPDAILILGDTNSGLSAISAKRRKIPIFHMEAGNRCFDLRVPEESNRKIIDNLSDINLTYSSISREHLISEGFPSDQVIKTGSPLKEVLIAQLEKIHQSSVLKHLNLNEEQYFVVSSHREENVDSPKNLLNLLNSLNSIAEKYQYPVIFSVHPRTQKRIQDLQIDFNPLIKFIKPLGFTDYVNLQMKAKAVLSDSGTITEEAAILNFPAVNLREAHERPEGMEESFVMMTGMNQERIMQALNILEKQPRGDTRILNMPLDYDVDNVSEKIVRIIHSYTDYVNQKVWKKY